MGNKDYIDMKVSFNAADDVKRIDLSKDVNWESGEVQIIENRSLGIKPIGEPVRIRGLSSLNIAIEELIRRQIASKEEE